MATKHTCTDRPSPPFGRKTPGCPRCDELLAGAEPVRWNTEHQRQRDRANAEQEGRRLAQERARDLIRAQLPTCCQSRISSWTTTMGRITEVSVRGCPRHGTVPHIAVKPVPALVYLDAAPGSAGPVLPEQLF